LIAEGGIAIKNGGHAQGAIYAALLLRRLVDRDPAPFVGRLMLGFDDRTQLETTLGLAINEILLPGGKATWTFEGLEMVKSELRASEAMTAILKADRGGSAVLEANNVVS
jgi:hypothetical protein